MKKAVSIITAGKAASLVKNGEVLMAGGFGMTGNPVHLLHALAETSTSGLTYIGNNVGESNLGGGRMLVNGQIKKMIGSFFTSNPDAVKAAQTGKVEYELMPQGTLAEAIRAGGLGIAGFYTPTAVGTPLAEGKEVRQIDGKNYLFAPAIKANVAFIRAWKADLQGNLQYRMTEQNFNKAMATAADLVIAEVEQIDRNAAFEPETIHTEGSYIDFLVEAHTNLDELGSSARVQNTDIVDPIRMRIARKAYGELKEGDVVNVGIGIPTLVADLIKPGDGIRVHTENGMLGVGPKPGGDAGAMDHPVNAGKVPVTALPGSSYFDSSDSFAMIRGGHVDIAVLGALQVDDRGSLANWAVPGKPLLGVGGAMDLATGARKVIITMTHTNRDGSSKIVPKCTLPLTAKNAVSTLITELAVFRVENNQLILVGLMPEASLEQVRMKTEASFVERLT